MFSLISPSYCVSLNSFRSAIFILKFGSFKEGYKKLYELSVLLNKKSLCSCSSNLFLLLLITTALSLSCKNVSSSAAAAGAGAALIGGTPISNFGNFRLIVFLSGFNTGAGATTVVCVGATVVGAGTFFGGNCGNFRLMVF